MSKRVLFICGENAGRSQMAEAFFNSYSQNTNYRAESCGTLPARKINPIVVEAMAEKGIDLSMAQPKQFSPEALRDYDVIISFGCLVKATLPLDIREKIVDWHIEDPREKPIEEVRKVRDVVERKVKLLIASLDGLEKERPFCPTPFFDSLLIPFYFFIMSVPFLPWAL